MNKMILILSFFVLNLLSVYSQVNYNTITYVYTCKNAQIEARIASMELSAAQKNAAKADLLDPNNSPETTVLLYSHATTKLAYSKTYPASTKQIKIDTSRLPNGVYYLNIVEKGETVKRQTIIINH